MAGRDDYYNAYDFMNGASGAGEQLVRTKEGWVPPHRIVSSDDMKGTMPAAMYDGLPPKDMSLRDVPQYRYGEDKSIAAIKDYIDSTYSAHYATEGERIQAIDAMFTLGNADTTCRDLIIKYAWRIGKKEGYRKDLMKIIHYAIFALYDCDRKGLK